MAGIEMAGELPGMTLKLHIPGYDSVTDTKVPPWITSR